MLVTAVTCFCINVDSGCRCNNHNKSIGGAKNSQHKPVNGMTHAVDIIVTDINPKEVYEFINGLFPNSLGLGLYSSWVHIDDRMDRAYNW